MAGKRIELTLGEQQEISRHLDKLINELFSWLEGNDPSSFPNFFKITLATRLGLLSSGINDWADGSLADSLDDERGAEDMEEGKTYPGEIINEEKTDED